LAICLWKNFDRPEVLFLRATPVESGTRSLQGGQVMTENIAFARRQDKDIDTMRLTGANDSRRSAPPPGRVAAG
jgi:hypothetical protein